MPQTLLALLALSLSSLLVFNQQRLQMRAQTQMVTNELSLAGSGLASDIMEMVGARSFDENSTPEKIHQAGAVPESPTAFTSALVIANDSTSNKNCDLLSPTPDCDDVDDIRGLEAEHYSILLAEGRELDFEVSTDVIYVTDAEGGIESDLPTRHKKVTIEVRSVNERSSVEPLRFSRVFSYDPIKAEMDYERIYGPIGAGGLIDDDDGNHNQNGGENNGGTHTQNGGY